MAIEHDVPELRPEQLKALTHPLRVRLLKELRTNGPATASLLARRLVESSGATSYHLRQLERHGFVREAPDTGDGRDRWWEPVMRGHHVATEKWLDDPESAAVVAVYQSSVIETNARAAAEWVATQADWPREWVEASVLNDYRLRLTPARFAKLTEALHATVERYAKHEAATGEQVVVQLHAFPRRVRPYTEDEA